MARAKIYLIQPKTPPSYWGQEYLLEMTSYDGVYPPLGLLTIAAATPPEYSVVLCDENAGQQIDYNTDADIIGISGYTEATNPVAPAAPTVPDAPTIGTATAGNGQATVSWTASDERGAAPQ